MDIAPGVPPRKGEKVVLSFHSGGYAKNSAHPDDLMSNICHGLLEHIQSIDRLFNLEYHLTHQTSDGKRLNCFPAVFLDAIAGYNYLVNIVGFSPLENITLGG